MAIVKNFLFCVDLKSGGIFLAWLSMISSPFLAILYAVLALHQIKIHRMRNAALMDLLTSAFLNVVSLLFILHPFYAYDFIEGIKKTNFKLMIPFLVNNSAFVILHFSGALLYSFVPDSIIYAGAYLMIAFVNLYIWLVVWSIYVEISASAKSKLIEPTPTTAEETV